MADTRKIIIAIDGPSGAGKGEVSRAVAERLNYLFVDSGAMYRVVALIATERGVSLDDAQAVPACVAGLKINLEKTPGGVRVRAGGRDVTDAIRRPDMSEGASRVAVFRAVREELVAQQRRIGGGGGVVMEGRDIGTVVFPEAELKVFLDASPEERARRRCLQQTAQGIRSSLEKTRQEISERDRRDTERKVSPLRRAPDAFYLDTTALSVEEAVEVIVRLAQKREREEREMP